VLIATLISLGRLSSDNEIVAMRTSGINIFSLILPLIAIGIIFSLALLIFNDRAASYTHYIYRKTLIEVGVKNPTAALEEGVSIDAFQKYIIFIYRVDQKKNKLSGVRIYEPQGEGKPTRTIIAKGGEFITDRQKNTVKLKLVDGTSDEPDPENPTNFYKLNFRTYFMNLNLAAAQNKGKIEKKPKEMTIQEIKQKIRELKINLPPLVTEIYEKITLAFSCLAFILIGAPLAIITRRREKSINIGIAVLIIVIYYPLFIGAEALGMQGYLAPGIAMWIPNILLGTVGLALTYKLCAS
jgi:lipopolysaccharide export system permease protein